MNPSVQEEVAQVYAEVDAAVAAARPRCDASGRCCRFTEFDHTLFISKFEAEILLEAAPPFPRPVGRDGCPFQVNNLCTVRDVRPLGCRIFFCDPNYAGVGEQITEEALDKLKRIADRHDTGWQYAPLHHFLNRHEPSTVGEEAAHGSDDSRVSLPLL